MRGRSPRFGFAALLAAVIAAVPAPAQELRGRVVVGENGVGEVAVTLHRVTAEGSGPVDRGRTDVQGRFRFAVPPADSSGFTVFFATADYLGVRYFGPPLHPGDARGAYTVVAHDTVSFAPDSLPIRIARRDVVLLPDPQGGWEVNEVLRLRNPTDRTVVPRRGGSTWTGRLPGEATVFEVGDGEIGPDRVKRIGSQLFLTAPLVPGAHELFFRYRLPPSGEEVALAADSPTDELNVLVREPAPALRVRGLRPAEPLAAEGERFLRYTGRALAPGARVVVAPETPVSPPVDPSLAAGAVAGVVLAIGGWFAARGHPAPGEPLGGHAG